MSPVTYVIPFNTRVEGLLEALFSVILRLPKAAEESEILRFAQNDNTLARPFLKGCEGFVTTIKSNPQATDQRTSKVLTFCHPETAKVSRRILSIFSYSESPLYSHSEGTEGARRISKTLASCHTEAFLFVMLRPFLFVILRPQSGRRISFAFTHLPLRPEPKEPINPEEEA